MLIILVKLGRYQVTVLGTRYNLFLEESVSLVLKIECHITLALGCIHTHFVHSISNSTVDHVEIGAINSLLFVTLVTDENTMYSTSSSNNWCN